MVKLPLEIRMLQHTGQYGLLHLYQASNDPYMIIQRGAGDTGIDLGGNCF